MDINAILAAMNAEGYSVKDVSADDLSAHLAALTEARDALAANVKAGTVTADADVIEATRATVAAIATLEAEMAERAAAGAQAQADLAQMLGLDAEVEAPETVEETETADQVDEVLEPVAASKYKPFDFPPAPKAPERTPVADGAVTASSEPAVKYYAATAKEAPNGRAILNDDGLRASWNTASKSAGTRPQRIAVAEIAFKDAVNLSDYPMSKDSGAVLADSHAKWKAGRADRLMSNVTGLTTRQAVTAACGVAPYRPILDIATPCAVRSFVDDLPTVVTTEKVEIYPRPEVDYSQVQAGVFTVTETQHEAGYVSDGGTTPDKECAKICPPDPIKCEPIATGFCAERDTFTETFWPSALAASEAILMNFAKLQADYLALEKMYDPTNGNPLVKKLAPIATSDFGVALDMLDWIDQLKNVIAACTGCDPDSIVLPDFLLRRAVADHQKRFGTRVSEAASEVLSALGNQDGMTVRTYEHAPQTWLLADTPATLSGGSLFSPSCVAPGGNLATGTPSRAAIFVGFTDGLYVARHREIEMSVQKPNVNRTEYLTETIATTCVTRSHWVLDVPVCVKGAVGAMAAVTCP